MESIRTHLHRGGRVVIPASYRRALNLEPGDEVVLVLEDKAVRLLPPAEAVKRAQALVRQFVPKGRRLAEELLKERRQELKREALTGTRGRS